MSNAILKLDWLLLFFDNICCTVQMYQSFQQFSQVFLPVKYFFPKEINVYHFILHWLNLKQRSKKRAALMTLFNSGVPNLHVGHICYNRAKQKF